MTSKKLITANHFHGLFFKNTPFIDVRAEGEYAKGCFPNSTNFPILNDHERHLVGICYKQKGQQAAIELGHQLVCGESKKTRIQNWCESATSNPNTHIYCWRGGMRSNLAQQWMHDVGIDVPLIEGGYKALRRSLTEVIDEAAINTRMIRIGGKTGVSKSELINEIPESIDLERYANHRGSSFGQMVNAQPTQANFEHALAIGLLHTPSTNFTNKILFVEDESKNIGAISIPLAFYDAMKRSQILLVEMPLDFRIQRILKEYVIKMLISFETQYPENGFEVFSLYLNDSLQRIQKRLGLERYKEIAQLLASALHNHTHTGSVQGHEAWIARLLSDYYDPMYEHQLSKKQNLIIFRGNYKEALEWALDFDNSRLLSPNNPMPRQS